MGVHAATGSAAAPVSPWKPPTQASWPDCMAGGGGRGGGPKEEGGAASATESQQESTTHGTLECSHYVPPLKHFAFTSKCPSISLTQLVKNTLSLRCCPKSEHLLTMCEALGSILAPPKRERERKREGKREGRQKGEKRGKEEARKKGKNGGRKKG